MQRTLTLIGADALSEVAQYTYAATAPANARLVFLAGSCPLNKDRSVAGIGDYAVQAGKAIENMVLALAAAGARIQDVLSTRVLGPSRPGQSVGGCPGCIS